MQSVAIILIIILILLLIILLIIIVIIIIAIDVVSGVVRYLTTSVCADQKDESTETEPRPFDGWMDDGQVCDGWMTVKCVNSVTLGCG